MNIKEDDLSAPEITALLGVHYTDATIQNPQGYSHVLDMKALKDSSITFWSVWDSDQIMGCGALRELSKTEGEIKSMHTHIEHRRKGVSFGLLTHIIKCGRARGYKRINLETHPVPGYAAARALYERFGFAYCGPFSNYEDDPNSVFMTLEL